MSHIPVHSTIFVDILKDNALEIQHTPLVISHRDEDSSTLHQIYIPLVNDPEDKNERNLIFNQLSAWIEASFCKKMQISKRELWRILVDASFNYRMMMIQMINENFKHTPPPPNQGQNQNPPPNQDKSKGKDLPPTSFETPFD